MPLSHAPLVRRVSTMSVEITRWVVSITYLTVRGQFSFFGMDGHSMKRRCPRDMTNQAAVYPDVSRVYTFVNVQSVTTFLHSLKGHWLPFVGKMVYGTIQNLLKILSVFDFSK